MLKIPYALMFFNILGLWYKKIVNFAVQITIIKRLHNGIR